MTGSCEASDRQPIKVQTQFLVNKLEESAGTVFFEQLLDQIK
jgi:hypothetical protein